MPSAAAADSEKAPAKPITIAVVDADDGTPLKDATVVVRKGGGYGKGEPVDDAGRRTVEYDATHTYVSFLARAPGHVPTTVYWQSPAKSPPQLPAEFTLRLPKAKRIGGKVVDEAAKPVAGATVILEYWPDHGQQDKRSPVVVPRIPEDELQTDAQGRWSYDGFPPDAKYIGVRVDHADFIRDDKMKPPGVAALLDGSAVTVLERGVDVAGTVTDAAGKPIVGARATTVRTSYVSNDYGTNGKTDAAGRFTLAHIRPGLAQVTVIAKGFAPDLVRVDVKPGMPPLAFSLAPGKTLRGRVIDQQGNPLKDAYLSLRGWRNAASLKWDGRTDADGRFTMPDAPADALEFHVGKEGYRYRINETLTARDDDQPVVVRMDPEIKIDGSVVDAETGKPIETFQVIEGVTLWENHPPFFSFDEAQPFAGGKYEMKSDAHEQVVESCVRIEAEGYVPAISPVSRGKSFTFNAALRRGRNLTGTLRAPDGEPVPNATVRLTYPGAQVDIWDDKVQRDNGRSAQTDSGGRFSFPPQVGDIYFVVLNDAGYIAVKGDASAEATDLKLEPWARISGLYAPGGKPLPGASLDAIIDPVREPRDTSPNLVWRLSDARTDSAGRFDIKHVPAFGGEPAQLMIGRLDVGGIDERRWLPVTLKPGETLALDVAGGRTVSGRVAPATPADRIDGDGWVLLKRSSKLPPEVWPTDILSAATQADPIYRAGLNPDHTFSFPSIPPGRYEYDLTLYSGDVSGAASGVFVLPEDAAGATFDLGEVPYIRSSPVAIGEPAPAILGRVFTDEPLKLADYTGKFVVVAVWDSCTGRSDAHLPYLNELPLELGPELLEKVALLSVNLDAVSCGMSGIPRRPHTLDHAAWVRGYIPMADQSVMRKLGQKKWPAVVIIDPQGKLRARDLDARDVGRELKAMMK